MTGTRRRRSGGRLYVGTFLPNEAFWARHVAPLTYRPVSTYVREAIGEDLARMATANYGVFVHLAGCHRQIQDQENEPDTELFAGDGLYAFYSRLYSAREAVSQFVDALGDVLEQYGGRSTRRKGPGAFKKALTLIKFLEPGLVRAFEDAFSEEAFAIRTAQVHFWGFPLIGGRIPTPEFLKTWLNNGLRERGLAALASFLKRSDRDAVFGDAKNFIDPVLQARADLERFETIIERVWGIALRELENLRDADRYRAAQRSGIEDTPPTKISTLVSSLTDAPSGRA